MGIWYCTRESVRRALDTGANARDDAQIDDAIEAASREIERCTNRVFYPWTGTRYVDWPDQQNGTSNVLWLEENEVASVSALTSGLVTIAPSAYNLEPNASGPPYDRIELKLSSSASFGLSDSRQRDVAISGVFAGAPVSESTAGQLGAAITGTVAAAVTVSDPAAVGVGSLLRVDSERLRVFGRAWQDSTQTATLSASNADSGVTVANGSVFVPDETILVGSERMLVTDVAGNTLVVRRAVLTDHAAAPVFRQTGLLVERGAVGTTAATHLTAAPIYRWDAPGPVRTLCRAAALDTALQEQGGYSRTVGSGDNARSASGAALANLWDRVEEQFRRYRMGVV
jgi:hypothetical protein